MYECEADGPAAFVVGNASSHREKEKRLEQDCNNLPLSDELEHSEKSTKSSSEKHNHCSICPCAEEKRPEAASPAKSPESPLPVQREAEEGQTKKRKTKTGCTARAKGGFQLNSDLKNMY